MPRPKVITRLDRIPQLSQRDKARLAPVTERFVFRTNTYYQRLIDWEDPHDPIRRIVIPETGELREWGELDASGEEDYTRAPGLEHKYPDTALLLVNDVCGAFCRFCFRKRLFMDGNDEVSRDVSPGLAYIRRHPEISNVLLTGGDPLLLSTSRLAEILKDLRAIPHVRIIRIGSKMPAFDPFRVLEDQELVSTLAGASLPDSRVYLMAHFNHPRELTPEDLECVDRLLKAGVVVVNQTPLLAGVNDDPRVLAELFDRLAFAGIPPYYVFICRPTAGNEFFTVPIERAWRLFDDARNRASGLGRRARLSMSHRTGKIEVLAVTRGQTVFRYHRAAAAADRGRIMIMEGNPAACWLDDYEMAATELAGQAADWDVPDHGPTLGTWDPLDD